MKKNVLCMMGLTCLLAACNPGKDSSGKMGTIDALVENADDKHAVFEDVSLIRLETTASCLLENVVKTDIGDDIYLLSSYGGKIYKFTKDGRYVWHIRQGTGPGELICATDFFVDTAGRSVYVLDNYRDLKIYSFGGKYLRTEHLPGIAFLFTKRDSSFLCFDPNLKRKYDFNLYVAQGGEITDEKLRKQEGTRNVGYMPANVFAFHTDNSVYIQHMLSDTVYSYSLSEHSLIPAFFINTNGLSVNAHHLDFPDSRSFGRICEEKNLLPGVAGLSFLNNKIYLNMFYDKRSFYVVYDVGTQHSAVFTSLCKGFPNSLRCVGRNKNGIVYCYNAEELMEYGTQGLPVNEKLSELMKSVKSEDNPILAIFR